MYSHLLSDDASLCTCSSCLWLCCLDPMYISALSDALETPSEFSSVPILVADPLVLPSSCEPRFWGNTLHRIYLSPERLPCSRDLAIRVTTTRNIRTRFPNTSNILEADLTTREGCETEKEYLIGIFHQLQLRQTLHARFCHITCCIERNIEHELLVTQWDSLKVAWILLKEARERLSREEVGQASTSQ